MSNSQVNTNVALLYQTQELGRHLRDALTSLGTPIVYEAATDHLDPGALEQSGARVVIVNLDPALEAHLDEVYGLLEDDRYSVVFNDAQVSSELSGWDQARWARHLAAKILGDADIDPPRPEGAEAVPTPAPVAVEERAHRASAAEETEAEEIEMVSEPEAGYDARLQSIFAPVLDEPAPATTGAGNPSDMLESRYDEMNQPATAAYPSPPPPPEDEFDFSTLEALTATPSPPAATSSTFADEFLGAESPVPEPEFAGETLQVVDGLDENESRVEEIPANSMETDPDLEVFDLAALDKLFGDAAEESSQVPARQASAQAHTEEASIDVGDLGDLDSVASTQTFDVVTDLKDISDTSVDVSGLSLLDDIVFDTPTAPKEAAPPMSPLRLAAAADWSLEDMLEGDAPPAAPVPTGRAEFGIEKVSAAEYLAPLTENTAPPASLPDLDSFSLELMPLEEAVAPQAIEREGHESWLDPDKVVVPPKIRRVWVLGASIGGPEALREFLSELPRDYPALFVLAQHMGAEFVDLMAQQLAKATALTVRTPTHGERVGHGEVVIVPPTHRLQVDPEGIVVLERTSNDGAYNPSIDRVLHDFADRYGANAGAIIFSGMTTDAVEGATYLASKGGTVYAQHPDTCVVSSMVDGVIEAGVAKVLGTPKELADVLLAESTKNKR